MVANWCLSVWCHTPHELLEMAQVLQSNTSLTDLAAYRMIRYTFKSLTKFVEIVTAPESKSRLELLVFGQHRENKDIVLLSNHHVVTGSTTNMLVH